MHARGWHNAERVTDVLARALDARPDAMATRPAVDAPVAAAAVTAAVTVTAVLRNHCPC
jgi:hypothetical protein